METSFAPKPKLRYLNELNKPALMPLHQSIQEMYDECRALLLAACLDVEDPVQSTSLMSAVHASRAQDAASAVFRAVSKENRSGKSSKGRPGFDAGVAENMANRAMVAGNSVKHASTRGGGGASSHGTSKGGSKDAVSREEMSPTGYKFFVDPDILISSILDYFQLFTNLRVLSLRYCGIDEHSVKRLVLPASLQRLYLDGNPLLDMGLVYLMLANPHVFGKMPEYDFCFSFFV